MTLSATAAMWQFTLAVDRSYMQATQAMASRFPPRHTKAFLRSVEFYSNYEFDINEIFRSYTDTRDFFAGIFLVKIGEIIIYAQNICSGKSVIEVKILYFFLWIMFITLCIT